MVRRGIVGIDSQCLEQALPEFGGELGSFVRYNRIGDPITCNPRVQEGTEDIQSRDVLQGDGPRGLCEAATNE